MAAVELGKSEAVKEMIKVKGVDLRTINRDGECLIKVARYVYAICSWTHLDLKFKER